MSLNKSPQKRRVALAQLCSSDKVIDNIAIMTELTKQAAKKNALLVAFPEVCNMMDGKYEDMKNQLFLEHADPHLKKLQTLASEQNIWLLLGSYLVVSEQSPEQWCNRSILINNHGVITARYDKIHLFDVLIAKDRKYRESEWTRRGNSLTLADSPIGKLGLTICYDLRFPYLFRQLNHMGAEIMMVPAAFTKTTGAAHWFSLLRARAIENACFILAPAQTGRHKNGRQTYGHTLAIDPWGRVIKNLTTEKNQLLLVDLDYHLLTWARQQIPSYQIREEEMLNPI